VLQAAVKGRGDSFDAPGRMKYWLQALLGEEMGGHVHQ